jgi:hypothetical protein
MIPVAEFTAFYHPRAAVDYRDPSGDVLSCALIAGAFRVLIAGEIRVVRPDLGSHAALRPRVEAEITWGGHVVCVKDGLVYDVLLKEPCPEADYLERAFHNPGDLVLPPKTMDVSSDFYLEEARWPRVISSHDLR